MTQDSEFGEMSWILAEIYGKGKSGTSINYRIYSRQIRALFADKIDQAYTTGYMANDSEIFEAGKKLGAKERQERITQWLALPENRLTPDSDLSLVDIGEMPKGDTPW